MIQADKGDNNIKVNITDVGDVPPYRIQSSVHVSGTSSQFLCHGARSMALWYKCSESSSRFASSFTYTCTNKQFMYHKLIDTQTSGTALYLATHSSTELKKKKSPQDETNNSSGVSQLAHFNLPRYQLDKCLPSSLAVCSFFALVFLEEFVYDGIISFGSCLSSLQVYSWCVLASSWQSGDTDGY